MPPPTLLSAIVLKSYETGDTSEVLHVVSGELGRFSVYGKGLRNPKNPLRAILQPLSHVELSVSMRDDAEMGTLREASLLEDHGALATDLERFSLGLLVAEAAAASCHVAQPAPEIFESLLHALRMIDAESHLAAPVAACAGLLGVLGAAGYEPGVDPELLRPWPSDQPRPHQFWLAVSEGLIHARGVQPAQAQRWPLPVPPGVPQFPLPPRAVRFLYESQRGGAAELPSAEAHQLLEGLVRLVEYHQEGPLKSAAFWREINGY